MLNDTPVSKNTICRGRITTIINQYLTVILTIFEYNQLFGFLVIVYNFVLLTFVNAFWGIKYSIYRAQYAKHINSYDL